MALNRSFSLRLIKVAIAIVIVLIIVIYIIFRSLSYTRGPKITIFQPVDWSSISTSVTKIEGRADRIIKVSLNGQPISTDESGNFSESVSIFPGANILTISADDQFNRTIESVLHLYGTVNLPVYTSTTTTTATSSDKK